MLLFIFLSFFPRTQNSILKTKYADKLFKLQKKIYNFQLHVATAWLGFIALDNKPDFESAKILLKYVRKNLVNFLKTNEKLSKKFFILLACINFNLASKLYKLIYKKNNF